MKLDYSKIKRYYYKNHRKINFKKVWIPMKSRCKNICCICNKEVVPKVEILWNKNTGKIKHYYCK